jgi:hypothetical protein
VSFQTLIPYTYFACEYGALMGLQFDTFRLLTVTCVSKTKRLRTRLVERLWLTF